ncbi:hypothetical protein [Flavobacterium sp. HSC-61S13]|uniref:hypothetical protein n=1 Tax=Flavobacterium sp. HSC-61S13 TaxID=2910963 RepID=UPI00209EDD03|nr:hypothetical protein [Flavobacterium sp. HSC-61S13]MCP1995745.1 hypothetical protein [Flavobacterium sp. HSC-61S13]
MKKTYLFHILFLAIIAVTGFSSCSEENIESTLLDQELVGESIVRLNYQDSLVIRKNVIASVDEKGKFSFAIEGKDKDVLSLQALRFETGVFPANINIAAYYFSAYGMVGFSVDADRPEYNTGWVRLNNINNVGKVVDGEFKIKIYPPVSLKDSFPDAIVKPFEVHGEFKNLRFTRQLADFFKTNIDGKDWVYHSRTVTTDPLTAMTVIKTVNTITDETMVFSFSSKLAAGATYTLDDFSAEYISATGTTYRTDKALQGSALKIITNKDKKVNAEFQLKMKQALGDQVLDFTEGSFNIAY